MCEHQCFKTEDPITIKLLKDLKHNKLFEKKISIIITKRQNQLKVKIPLKTGVSVGWLPTKCNVHMDADLVNNVHLYVNSAYEQILNSWTKSNREWKKWK